MSPLGKFVFAVFGLRFFGAEGFLVGMLLGHMLIDKTIIICKIGHFFSSVDDNIRLMLPYRYYRYYNRLDGNFWGKILGGLIGALLYGADGFIFLFILGHFLFDTPESRHARKVRKVIDHFWDNNWAKIGGAIAGFVLQSKIVLFLGIVVGFFIDYYRVENASLIPVEKIRHFWFRINPLKLWRHSKEARHVAYIQAMAGLAAKVAKADGFVSTNEIRVFKQTFAVKQEENSKVADIFNYAKMTADDFEPYAKQLFRIVENNLELKETVIDNLFKIAAADGSVSDAGWKILKKTAKIIQLPEGNFDMVAALYMPKTAESPLQSFYDELGLLYNVSDNDVKKRWKELIVLYHPDRLQAQGADATEIEKATLKMAQINNAYQMIMKARKS